MENWRETGMPRLDVLRESCCRHEGPVTVATAVDLHIPIFDPRVVADLQRPGLCAAVRHTAPGRRGTVRAVARVAGWSRCADAIDRGRTGDQHN